MTTNSTPITVKNALNLIDEIKEAFYDIPFDNSAFQTEAFVIASEVTPERTYRAVGLKLLSSIQMLEEAELARKEADIDLAEIEHNISQGNLNTFEIQRLEIKKQRLLNGRTWSDKLLNDLIVNLNVTYSHFSKLPRFTREQFEAGERRHFEQKLTRQIAGIEGPKAAIINMNEDTKALTSFQNLVLDLPKDSDYSIRLQKAALSLPNLLLETTSNKDK